MLKEGILQVCVRRQCCVCKPTCVLRVFSAGGGEALPGLQRREPLRQQCGSPPARLRLSTLEGSASPGREGKTLLPSPEDGEVCGRGRAAAGSAGALQQAGSRGRAATERGCRRLFPALWLPLKGGGAASLPSRSFQSLPEPDGVTEIVPKPRRSSSRDFSESDFLIP